jgi:hypothetical protein
MHIDVNAHLQPSKQWTTEELDALVVYASYADVAALPGFATGVDPLKRRPTRPVGILPKQAEPHNCGLRCNHQQRMSWVVECDDQTTTLIGVTCGRNWLGIEAFDQMRARLERGQEMKRHLDTLRIAVSDAPHYAARVRDLLDGEGGGLRWALDRIRDFDVRMPDNIRRQIKARASRGEALVTELVRRTEAELSAYDSQHEPDEADEAALRRYRSSESRLFVPQVKGYFVGLETFEVDGRALITKTLRARVEDLMSLRPGELSAIERREWSKWLGELDGNVAKARTWLRSVQLFFSESGNRSLIAGLAKSEADRRALMKFPWPTAESSRKAA